MKAQACCSLWGILKSNKRCEVAWGDTTPSSQESSQRNSTRWVVGKGGFQKGKICDNGKDSKIALLMWVSLGWCSTFQRGINHKLHLIDPVLQMEIFHGSLSCEILD